MEKMMLSKNDLSDLANIIFKAEQTYGTAAYEKGSLSAWDCDRWDCAVSCDCANSRN